MLISVRVGVGVSVVSVLCTLVSAVLRTPTWLTAAVGMMTIDSVTVRWWTLRLSVMCCLGVSTPELVRFLTGC